MSNVSHQGIVQFYEPYKINWPACPGKTMLGVGQRSYIMSFMNFNGNFLTKLSRLHLLERIAVIVGSLGITTGIHWPQNELCVN